MNNNQTNDSDNKTNESDNIIYYNININELYAKQKYVNHLQTQQMTQLNCN